MLLAMHSLTRSAHTAGRVLDFSTEIRTNDMFKKRQETDQSKTIILLTLARFHAQMSLEILEKTWKSVPYLKRSLSKKAKQLN